MALMGAGLFYGEALTNMQGMVHPKRTDHVWEEMKACACEGILRISYSTIPPLQLLLVTLQGS